MTNNTSNRRHISVLMIATLLFATLAPTSAMAGIVGTGSAINEQSSLMNRDALIEQLGRDDVRMQLEQMGVNADEAVERVAAMTDSDVIMLSNGLAEMPAGAGVGVVAAVLIVVLVVLLLR